MNLDSPSLKTSRRYAMFISYRHADNLEMGRKWATWLHETVEAYEVPPDLVGRENLRGETVPSTLYPVFRDEEELPADADLSTNIQRALENSSLLVVLCSPRAVQSRFVADEIRYFKELGKSGRILALIIDGEPNASDDPEKRSRLGAAAECFPEPLRFGVPDDQGGVDWTRRTEPIAADCRPGGRPVQGWTTAAAYQEWLDRESTMDRAAKAAAVREYAERLDLAKLKVIAGALGLPLGELTQRDKARQLLRARQRARVLTGLSVSFALLAGVAAWMGWLAQQKRKDAEAQRREAEAQRRVALEQRKAADESRVLAEAERKQAVATLAASDFQEGVNRLADPRSARLGLAFLARSARAGNPAAASRIWTLYQQRDFWLPVSSSATVPELRAPRLSPLALPESLKEVVLEGSRIAPTWYARSADGRCGVTVVSTAEAGEGPITFRFWRENGSPIGPWRKIDYTGDNYLSGIAAAAVSDDGRLAAIIAQPWRAPQFVEVWDVEKGRKIGTSVTASGAHPNVQGGAFTDVWFAQAAGEGGGSLLVTLSNRGDACVHRVETTDDGGELLPLATHSHDQPVSHAALNAHLGRFVSAAVDQSVRVSALSEEGALGGPIPAPGLVEGLRIDAEDRVTLRHGGEASSWQLSRPPARAVPGDLQLRQAKDASLRKSWEEEEPAEPSAPVVLDQRGKRQLRVVNRTELELIDADAPSAAPAWKRGFPAAISHARFLDDESVLVQTDFFTTVRWSLKEDAAIHPVIDEATLFTVDDRSDTVLPSSVSADGKRVLTRSFFWDPPNVGIHAFTLWDAATAKPLCDPCRFVENVALENLAENHAEFSEDGKSLWFGRAGEDGPPKVMSTLVLDPPDSVRPWIADLAESLAGLRIAADGSAVPVNRPAEVILQKVRDAER